MGPQHKNHRKGDRAPGKAFRPAASLILVAYVCAAAAALICGCQLIPTKPDAVFVLYRDRMRSESLEEARNLLTDDSRKLALRLVSEYKLRQPPEDLALLNALDPAAAPVVVKVEETVALLQVRTLKGGVRSVRLVRTDASSPWKVDMSEELRSLQAFLEARQALDTMREQAGEYAATWKAFSDRMGKMTIIEPVPQKPAPPAIGPRKAMPQKKTKRAKPKKETKQSNKPG